MYARVLVMVQELQCYGMIWHTLVIIIMAQNFVFIWYDTAYPNIKVQNFIFMV